jgi:uncharacterized protein
MHLGRLARLGQAIRGGDPSVEVDLRFLRDEEKRALVTGRITADLQLQCQRCLEPLRFPVELDLRLAVVETDAEARLLPDDVDPLLVEGGSLSLADLVEDELILALPQVPMHGLDVCPAADMAAGETASAEERESPFVALTELKRRGD